MYLKDADKLKLIIPNILRPCLSDPSDEIVTATQNGLLLSIAYRASMLDLNDLLLSTLNELNDSCLLLEHSDKKPTAQVLNSTSHSDLQNSVFTGGQDLMVMYKLGACQNLLPFVISSVIKSSPVYHEMKDYIHESDPAMAQPNYHPTALVTSDHLLSMLFETQQNAIQCIEELQKYLAREWYEPWSQLTWISEVFLGLSIESASKIPVPVNLCCDTSHKMHNITSRSYNSADTKDEIHDCLEDSLILKFVDFFRELVLILGPSYTDRNIISKFEDRLPLINYSETTFDQTNDDLKSNLNVYSSALLPIYFLGVLKNLQPDANAGQMVEIIRKWCIIYCLQGLPKHPLLFSIQHILIIEQSRQHYENDAWHSDIRDALSEMAWSLVVHSSPKIRAFSGVILDILASCGKLFS